MASLSRKARLQRCSWQLLEDLAFCCQRHQRRAELAAQVLVEKQGAMAPPSGGSGAVEALAALLRPGLQPAGLPRRCLLAGREAGCCSGCFCGRGCDDGDDGGGGGDRRLSTRAGDPLGLQAEQAEGQHQRGRRPPRPARAQHRCPSCHISARIRPGRCSRSLTRAFLASLLMASSSPRCEIRQLAGFVYPGGIKAPDAERHTVFYARRGRPVKKPRYIPGAAGPQAPGTAAWTVGRHWVPRFHENNPCGFGLYWRWWRGNRKTGLEIEPQLRGLEFKVEGG